MAQEAPEVREFVSTQAVHEAIALFQVWAKSHMRYTGKTKNANRMARVLHIYQHFVRAHPIFWAVNFNYHLRARPPGQLAHIYSVFRDEVVLIGLRQLRAEQLDLPIEEVPEVRYHYKRVLRADGQRSPRAVVGWEFAGH